MIFNLFGSKKKKEESKPQNEPYAQKPSPFDKPAFDPYAQQPSPFDQKKEDKDNDKAKEPVSTPTTSSAVSTKGTFKLEDVKRNADAAVPQEKNKTLAYGAYRYAEVIANNIDAFGDVEIDYMVRPSDLDPTANKDALPIHFLFKKNSTPKVAVVIVTTNGFKAPRVVATRLWCELNGIKYIRMYADGTYSDWMTGEGNEQYDADELQEFCHNWIVEKISDALK